MERSFHQNFAHDHFGSDFGHVFYILRDEVGKMSRQGMALSTLIILILAIILLLFMIAWYTTGLSDSLTRVWEGFTRLI